MVASRRGARPLLREEPGTLPGARVPGSGRRLSLGTGAHLDANAQAQPDRQTRSRQRQRRPGRMRQAARTGLQDARRVDGRPRPERAVSLRAGDGRSRRDRRRQTGNGAAAHAEALEALAQPMAEPSLLGFSHLLRAQLLARLGRFNDASTEISAAAKANPAPHDSGVDRAADRGLARQECVRRRLENGRTREA